MDDSEEEPQQSESRRASRALVNDGDDEERRESLVEVNQEDDSEVQRQQEEQERQRREEEERKKQEAELKKQQEEAAKRKKQQEDEEQEQQNKEEQRKLEAQLERQKKAEEKKKKEAAEVAKKGKSVPGQKRKGLGGLSTEKKKLLKQLIMQKAADEMKAEMKKRTEEKENHLKKIIGPLEINGLNQAQLDSKVKELYKRVNQLHEEKYDWEFKLMRQDLEINELTTKVNDTRGKFAKPVLKKITKTESKVEKLQKQKDALDLSNVKTQLKSTGQNKFALEEKEEGGAKSDWREHLKGGKEDADGSVENGEIAA